jgi:hypothetical protein
MKRVLFHAGLMLLLLPTIFLQTSSRGVQRSVVDKQGNRILVETNPQTGSPHRVHGLDLNIKKYGLTASNLTRESVEDLTNQIMAEYKDVLQVGVVHSRLQKLDSDGQVWFVACRQVLNGVPIHGTEIGYTIDPSGRMVTFGADVYPDAVVPPANATYGEGDANGIVERDFQFSGMRIRNQSELLYYPRETGGKREFNLAWKVTAYSHLTGEGFIYFVDARNGKILDKIENNLKQANCTATGHVHGWYAKDEPAPFTTNSFNLGLTEVELLNDGEPYGVTADCDTNGNFSLVHSTQGLWGIRIYLQNDYVQLRHSDETPHFRDISGTCTSHDVEWGTSGEVLDSVNIFYHVNKMHSYIKNTFTYTGMDYRMPVYIHDNPGNISWGGAGMMSIAVGHAFYSDVLYHEYTHNVIYELYNDDFIAGTSGMKSEGAAMDEAFAFYFAGTVNNSPDVSGWDLDNNWCWSTFYPSDTGSYTFPHKESQVIGGACWDVRGSLGATITDNLVFRALQMTPHARYFSEFLYNMVMADSVYYSGVHTGTIRSAFATHCITDAPVTISPSNEAWTSTSVTLTWHDVASSLRVQLATDSTFASLVKDSTGLTGTSLAVSNLTRGTRYYWRVKSNSPLSSDWSATAKFKTTPAAPTLVSPENWADVEGCSSVLTWRKASLAEKYRIQLCKLSSFTGPVTDVDNLTDTTYTLAAVNGGRYWRVASKYGTSYSEWSSVWHLNFSDWCDCSDPSPCKVSVPADTVNGIPSVFALNQNYPNPFNPTTTIDFDLPVESEVHLSVFNVLGEEIDRLVDESLKPGSYQIKWDGKDLPSGVYFYRLLAGEYLEMKQMLLMR